MVSEDLNVEPIQKQQLNQVVWTFDEDNSRLVTKVRMTGKENKMLKENMEKYNSGRFKEKKC